MFGQQLLLLARQMHTQRRGHMTGDVVLQRQDLGELPFVPLTPHSCAPLATSIMST
jgi:hypothetical protein